MRVLVATPCYGAMLCLNYVTSVIRLKTACIQAGVDLEFLFKTDSLITRARNHCVSHFLDGDWSHLFFIDADIGFEPSAALRLINAGHDVAAGIYPIKSEGAGFPIDRDVIGSQDEHGFAEANEAPTGFMCITRRVFERLLNQKIGRNEFFDTMHDGPEYLSEDYAFCRRWRNAGGRIHVDMRSDLTHQGTKLFTGKLDAH